MIIRILVGSIRKYTMLAVSLLFLFPLYIALTNSVKPYEDIIKSPLSLPFNFTLANFREAFEKSHIQELYLNSLVITVISVASIVVTGAMGAYVIVRNKNRWTRFLYVFFLAGIMIPGAAVLIPTLKTLIFLHLLGKLPGLILFYLGTNMSIVIFLYGEFLKTIPPSMEESALIDGANLPQIFFKIIFPLVRPCTGTAVIFLGMWIWNDFQNPLYILGSQHGLTITTGIYAMVGIYTTFWNIVFACTVLGSLPVLILYLAMQKQFMKGLTAGAVKG